MRKEKEMSRPRYDWWPYVKGMIRRYPALKQELETLHEQSTTAQYSGMPRGGGVSRGTENIAVRELPTTKQREYEAVRRAIEQTEQLAHGSDVLEIVRLVLWKRSHTLDGVAVRLHCGIATAKRYHGEFIRTVAKNYGLLDE